MRRHEDPAPADPETTQQDDPAPHAGRKRASADAALGPAEAARLFRRVFAGRSAVVLAVSGGADSLALLTLAAEWAARRDATRVFVATVDHGLRAEAETEIAAVARLSNELGLPHARLVADLGAAASKIEETARKSRYAALAEHARAVGADAIATAHTLDDQAETVLMRLAAGSGPAGLAAMRAETRRDGVALLRPFLSVSKARLVATLQVRGVRWSEDAMNADPRFARARLRGGRRMLEREGLTAERLATLAFRMARLDTAVDDAVNAAADAHLSRDRDRWVIDPGAATLPDEIKLRLLARAIAGAGGGRLKLERLERLADRIVTEPSGAGTLAGARVAWTEKGRVVARPEPPRRRHGAKPDPGL